MYHFTWTVLFWGICVCVANGSPPSCNIFIDIVCVCMCLTPGCDYMWPCQESAATAFSCLLSPTSVETYHYCFFQQYFNANSCLPAVIVSFIQAENMFFKKNNIFKSYPQRFRTHKWYTLAICFWVQHKVIHSCVSKGWAKKAKKIDWTE